ncbi:MAG: hypothetical protein EBT47_03960, partial [Chloroflexi bacterium]|nr:hypothetical protein [Chloroflexota bacterium]
MPASFRCGSTDESALVFSRQATSWWHATTLGRLGQERSGTPTGAIPVDLGQALDEPDSVRVSLLKGVDQGCDLIVTSGGVSMGDRDMVKHVIRDDGEVSIWSIDLRPGKPFTFGRFHGVPILALPGNPVSAMVTYELLVNPIVRRMQGDRAAVPVEVMAIADQEIVNDSGRENFVR